MTKRKQTFKMYTSADAIEKAITSIGNRSKTIQQDVHKAACSILLQWHITGDVRPVASQFNRLIAALGEGMRANALRSWVETFGMQAYNPEDKLFVKGKATKIKEDDVKASIQEPWYSFKPEPAYKPMDFDALLVSIIKRTETRVEKGLTKDDNINLDHLAALKKIVKA